MAIFLMCEVKFVRCHYAGVLTGSSHISRGRTAISPPQSHTCLPASCSRFLSYLLLQPPLSSLLIKPVWVGVRTPLSARKPACACKLQY